LIWTDNRFGSTNFEILYKRSTDDGATWGTDTRLTNDPAYSAYCDISASGQYVHVVWQDSRYFGNYNLFYKRSTDGGTTWEADNRITYNGAGNLSVVSSGQFVHMLWVGGLYAQYGVHYKRSVDNGASWVDSTQLTTGILSVSFPSISFAGDAVHVLWSDTRNTNSQIYYKRNPTGNTIGIHNISTEIPSAYSLKQNYSNPFNPTTTIRFTISDLRFTILKVYDVLGNEITTLVNEKLAPGTYEVDWPAPSGNGSGYASGVYFYRIQTDEFSETKKMLMIK
jgi:hypothetical protein